MKDTNNMLGGGALLPEYARTWAEYFSKWITAYKQQVRRGEEVKSSDELKTPSSMRKL